MTTPGRTEQQVQEGLCGSNADGSSTRNPSMGDLTIINRDSMGYVWDIIHHWIGGRENLHETFCFSW